LRHKDHYPGGARDGDLSYGERLQPFDIVCVMRERTPMTRTIIERLPKLRMIASTATRNASISWGSLRRNDS
jgi:phosphoglycerate dehydrogenase-like enzyme